MDIRKSSCISLFFCVWYLSNGTASEILFVVKVVVWYGFRVGIQRLMDTEKPYILFEMTIFISVDLCMMTFLLDITL